jgi:1,6-anhydro-N-acetylmuramate kinase
MVAQEKKVFASDFASPLWESWLVEDCFKQEHWLFGYEANRQGWLGQKVRAAKLRQEPSVKALTEAGVTFVNVKQIASYLPKKLVVHGGGGGGGEYF